MIAIFASRWVIRQMLGQSQKIFRNSTSHAKQGLGIAAFCGGKDLLSSPVADRQGLTCGLAIICQRLIWATVSDQFDNGIGIDFQPRRAIVLFVAT